MASGPKICPDCRFANKSGNSICSNCGGKFPVAKPLTPAPAVTDFQSIEKKSLFSSLLYRVQDLTFDGSIIRLFPYTGSIHEIIVEFKQDQIIMSGCMKHSIPFLNFKLKNKDQLHFSNDGLWRNITLRGEEEIINRIKEQSRIAELMVSIGTVNILVETQPTGETCIQAIYSENKEAVTQAFSLITELQSFFEAL